MSKHIGLTDKSITELPPPNQMTNLQKADCIKYILSLQRVRNYKPPLGNKGSANIMKTFINWQYSSLPDGTDLSMELKNAVRCLSQKQISDNLSVKRESIVEKIKTMKERQKHLQESTEPDDRKDEKLELIDIELMTLEKNLSALQSSNPAIDIVLAGVAANVLHVLAENNGASKSLYDNIKEVVCPSIVTITVKSEFTRSEKTGYDRPYDRSNDRSFDKSRFDNSGYNKSGFDRSQSRTNDNSYYDAKHANELHSKGKFVPPQLRKYIVQNTETETNNKHANIYDNLDDDNNNNNNTTTTDRIIVPTSKEPIVQKNDVNNPWFSNNKTKIYEKPPTPEPEDNSEDELEDNYTHVVTQSKFVSIGTVGTTGSKSISYSSLTVKTRVNVLPPPPISTETQKSQKSREDTNWDSDFDNF